jgi:hypothetical protein
MAGKVTAWCGTALAAIFSSDWHVSHLSALVPESLKKQLAQGGRLNRYQKVAEIVCRFSPEDQAAALEAAERRYGNGARLRLHRNICPISRICNHQTAAQTSESAANNNVLRPYARA